VSEKRILIITYYWPPSGGSGVQRWLKFAKYLPQFGWKPYVFTPQNPSFAIQDASLLKDIPPEAEVIRYPIWEPYDAFFKISNIVGTKKTAKPTDLVSGNQKSLFQKISAWLRGNLFIPDPRVFWVKPSVKFLSRFIEENKINIIVTTGPPHSMHLIGLRLKRKKPSLRWIADFRDPWSEWGLLDSLMVGSIARARHKKLEANVLKTADEIVTITPFYVRQFEMLSGRKVKLYTNGFDEDDFTQINYKRSDKFIIRHIGIVNEKCDPRPFMQAVLKLMSEDHKFRSSIQIEFIGEVHQQFKNYVSSIPELSSVTKFAGNILHKELISLYGNSSLLILILHGYKDGEGFMPGKLFEYLATGLPVLGVGPAIGDASDLLAETNSGKMFDAADQIGIILFLKNQFENWNNVVTNEINTTSTHKYTRRKITEEFALLLSNLLNF
jgi:glycosyltransferase involved in cell wall biosynthesis